MKYLNFLHELKLVVLPVALLLACVAACFRPQAQLALSPSTEKVVENQQILHIGKGQASFVSYQNIDEQGRIAVLVREDQSLLHLKYNLKGTDQVTLRLYDHEGSLQHIEKLMNVYKGMEKSLDLGHLEEGEYQLELSTKKGLKISQRISFHTHEKL
jgi:hypothetical protein